MFVKDDRWLGKALNRAGPAPRRVSCSVMLWVRSTRPASRISGTVQILSQGRDHKGTRRAQNMLIGHRLLVAQTAQQRLIRLGSAQYIQQAGELHMGLFAPVAQF